MQMGCIMRPYFRGGARIFFAGGVLEVTTGRFMRGRSPHVQACSPPTLQPPSQRPIAYRQEQNRPKSDSTSPVKSWHIPLGRMRHHLFLHTHIHHRISFHACAPTVAPFHTSQVHRIITLLLAHKHAVAHHHRVNTPELLNPKTINCFAAWEGTQCYTQAQCQDGSQTLP